MKNIQKTAPPATYSTWCNTQKALGVNYNYASLHNPEKRDLHNALVKEQGEICAYTMKRISSSSSHIEHIRPQNLCVNGEDLEYSNLVACYPEGKTKTTCPYGAERKGGWWHNNGKDFISPLNEDCELKFLYEIDGEVKPVSVSSVSAKTTIQVLNLNESSLVNERKQAIEEFIYGGPLGTLSPSDAEHAIDSICKPNAAGLLNEFCIAIHDALYEYLDIF